MEIKARFDHFNINVTDLERSLAFYDRALGLKEISRKQADDGSFILAYLGDGETGFRLELTWLRRPTNWARTKATSASASRATTKPYAPTTRSWDASASKTTKWDSTSSTIRTTTGSKCCP